MNRSSSRVWSAGHIAWDVVALTLVKVVLIFEAQAVIFSGWRTSTRQLRPADKRLLGLSTTTFFHHIHAQFIYIKNLCNFYIFIYSDSYQSVNFSSIDKGPCAVSLCQFNCRCPCPTSMAHSPLHAFTCPSSPAVNTVLC
jgi:hypothetical protein